MSAEFVGKLTPGKRISRPIKEPTTTRGHLDAVFVKKALQVHPTKLSIKIELTVKAKPINVRLNVAIKTTRILHPFANTSKRCTEATFIPR
jgi:hypothetical protein